MTDTAARKAVELLETGIPGLDDVLDGGLAAERLYLLEGDPGSGKTTLALQFLLAGARRGQRGLFVSLSESAKELHASARSHGWSLEGIGIFELVLSDESNRCRAGRRGGAAHSLTSQRRVREPAASQGAAPLHTPAPAAHQPVAGAVNCVRFTHTDGWAAQL